MMMNPGELLARCQPQPSRGWQRDGHGGPQNEVCDNDSDDAGEVPARRHPTPCQRWLPDSSCRPAAGLCQPAARVFSVPLDTSKCEDMLRYGPSAKSGVNFLHIIFESHILHVLQKICIFIQMYFVLLQFTYLHIFFAYSAYFITYFPEYVDAYLVAYFFLHNTTLVHVTGRTGWRRICMQILLFGQICVYIFLHIVLIL
jgi:hypothetical protein